MGQMNKLGSWPNVSYIGFPDKWKCRNMWVARLMPSTYSFMLMASLVQLQYSMSQKAILKKKMKNYSEKCELQKNGNGEICEWRDQCTGNCCFYTGAGTTLNTGPVGSKS